MKQYTQEDVNQFKRDKDGYIHCPTGEYANNIVFPERCSFGEACSFGEWCSFGENCRFGERCSFGENCRFGENCSFGENCTVEGGFPFQSLLKVEGCGRARRVTYFFLLTDGTVLVRCGCFLGRLNEFEKQVHETHQGNRHEREYMAAVQLAKIKFGLEEREWAD